MPSRRRLPHPWLLMPVALLAGLGTWSERSGWLYVWLPQLAPAPLADDGRGELLRVVDGDTVLVRYHDLPLYVRLRCVDTAESVHPDPSRNEAAGQAASDWVKTQLAGKSIRLEFQRDRWGIETDRHGRALGWLWYGAADAALLLNEELIRAGWSRYETKFGHAGRYHARLHAADSDRARP